MEEGSGLLPPLGGSRMKTMQRGLVRSGTPPGLRQGLAERSRSSPAKQQRHGASTHPPPWRRCRRSPCARCSTAGWSAARWGAAPAAWGRQLQAMGGGGAVIRQRARGDDGWEGNAGSPLPGLAGRRYCQPAGPLRRCAEQLECHARPAVLCRMMPPIVPASQQSEQGPAEPGRARQRMRAGDVTGRPAPTRVRHAEGGHVLGQVQLLGGHCHGGGLGGLADAAHQHAEDVALGGGLYVGRSRRAAAEGQSASERCPWLAALVGRQQ
jgi:hypothetical protein